LNKFQPTFCSIKQYNKLFYSIINNYNFRQIERFFIDLAENEIVLNNKTLGKNHKIHDFFPEFYQNAVETLHGTSLQTAY